jgi:hypothetical protein
MKVIDTDEPMGFADMLVTRWFVLRRGDVLAILVSAAILVIVAIALAKAPPYFGRTGNFGFGPDWGCSYPGDGEPVCVKKPAPSVPTKPSGARGGG